jgi:molybdopterin-guanine dinucleotide biosynthesis protein A
MGESVLLAGGGSRRMGTDKASLTVEGQALSHRIAFELQRNGWPVTVLGGAAIEGCGHVDDQIPGNGPLSALSGFKPSEELVFVTPCDIPKFNGLLPGIFENLINGHEAVIPVLDGHDQTLCALYRKAAFVKLAAHPDIFRVRDWIEFLRVRRVDESELESLGASADWIRSANTPEEFSSLISG